MAHAGSRRKMPTIQIAISSTIVQPTKATMAVMSRIEPRDLSASVRRIPSNGDTNTWLRSRMPRTSALASRASRSSSTIRSPIRIWMSPKIRTTTRRASSPPLGRPRSTTSARHEYARQSRGSLVPYPTPRCRHRVTVPIRRLARLVGRPKVLRGTKVERSASGAMGEKPVAQPNVVANLVDKQSRELGIELRARTAGELLKRPLDRARRLIRAGMGHRVECVGDADDPRLQRDALPAQSIGIARAIDVLVMPAGDPTGDLEALALGQNLGAPHRMATHDRPFVGRQRPGLEQDPVGHMELADVVEHRRPTDVSGPLGVQARGPGELLGNKLDPHDVVAGIGVLGLGAAREGNHPIALTLRDFDGRRAPAERGGSGVVEEIAGEATHQGEGGSADRPRVRLFDTPSETREGREGPQQEGYVHRGHETASPAKE